MIGTLLANRYRIDAQLGEGGMGVVYRAHDTVLDRPVAIKTLYQALFGDVGLKRLIRGARAAAGLQHPNIVAIYDVLDDAVPTPRWRGRSSRWQTAGWMMCWLHTRSRTKGSCAWE